MSADDKKEYTSTGREVTLVDRVFDQMVRGVVVLTTRLEREAKWDDGLLGHPFGRSAFSRDGKRLEEELLP